MENSEESTTCPICKKSIKWTDYNTHVPSCASVCGQCSRCEEIVPSSVLKEHFLEKCPKLPKTDKTNRNDNEYEQNSQREYMEKEVEPKFANPFNPTEVCIQCMKNIPKSEFLYHKIRDCKMLENQCPYCEKRLTSESKECHLQICDVFKQITRISSKKSDEKPEVGQCKYCKITLNSNILLFHQKECVHQPVKCPDCSTTTLLKDIDLHSCKPAKGKGKARISSKKSEKSENNSWWPVWLYKSNVKTDAESQAARNEYFSEKSFLAPILNDPKLPCEFCGQLFPPSEIVLHTTGCNPAEASLPPNVNHQNANKKADENSIQTRQSKETWEILHQIITPSAKYEIIQDRVGRINGDEKVFMEYENEPKVLGKKTNDENRIHNERFGLNAGYLSAYGQKSDDEKRAGAERTPSSTKSENVHKHLEQKFDDGNFLDFHYSKMPSKSESYSDHKTRVKQSHSSPFKSVWSDDDTLDVEIEELQPETNFNDLTEKMMKEKEKTDDKSSCLNEREPTNSEEEMDEMLQFISNEEMKRMQELEENSTGAHEDHNIQSGTHFSEGIDKLTQDFKSLFLSGQYSDVVLKVQDREFKMHRNILSVRSTVFASMLQHDMKENATGVVNIPDCTAEVFEIFLSYIYTGSADDISAENVLDLYYAADKYEIDTLKTECITYIEQNLSVENFCVVMTLSLLHTDKRLQEKAMQFFCDNFREIIKTTQWMKYVQDNPIQANELFIKASTA